MSLSVSFRLGMLQVKYTHAAPAVTEVTDSSFGDEMFHSVNITAKECVCGCVCVLSGHGMVIGCYICW